MIRDRKYSSDWRMRVGGNILNRKRRGKRLGKGRKGGENTGTRGWVKFFGRNGEDREGEVMDDF